ncbi:DNA replication/checkpoint protein [Biscogniauxia mediterranea]|nr:DNA replication/checkpoint protein [Biscogniauxia mediterranea]
MDDLERQKYEAMSSQLRTDLKRFEAEWAQSNGGKKPGRNDIKKNPEIAHKYKKYNQVRDVLSGKIPPPSSKETCKDPSKARKRKSDEGLDQTPTKRSRATETPSKNRYQDIQENGFETPSARKLFSPPVPTSVGPTPQRDGRILGLFDLLTETEENTPQKSRDGESPRKKDKIQSTPSKRSASEMEEVKLGRTPMSSSKRIMLDTFMTPLKNRDNNSGATRTPTSVSKLQFATPSFLRRAPLPTVDENGEYVAPAPLRFPRKPLGRSLSSVVAGLRKLEEEELDDDLEAMREAENEGSMSQPTKPTAKPIAKPKDDVLEPDSQKPQLLGGFDDEGLYDSPDEEQVGRNGQPLKVYKKKGQKRTTRRVNMRPTRAKRPDQSTEAEPGDDDDDEVVPETQFDATKPDDEPLDLGSDSEFEDEDGEDNEEASVKNQAKKSATKEKTEKKEGKIKKAARKVNELAHANFKRLKLRNHGAKGGPSFGSRFRRRR